MLCLQSKLCMGSLNWLLTSIHVGCLEKLHHSCFLMFSTHYWLQEPNVPCWLNSCPVNRGPNASWKCLQVRFVYIVFFFALISKIRVWKPNLYKTAIRMKRNIGNNCWNMRKSCFLWNTLLKPTGSLPFCLIFYIETDIAFHESLLPNLYIPWYIPWVILKIAFCKMSVCWSGEVWF